MSITLVTGVPGSGKSFFCMDMLEKMLRTNDQFLVLTNVEGLKVEDSRVIVCDWKRETKWFQNATQEKGIRKLRDEHNLPDDAKIYYIIDEAQRFFPPELKDNETVFFFDYHRHYGVDIYLVSQHLWKLSKKIATLVELEYRAVNNRINPLPVFVYKVLAGGEQFKTIKLKKRKQVFALYCSFQAGDKGKSDKSMMVWVALAFFVMAGGWMAWRSAFANSLGARTRDMQGLPGKPTIEQKAAEARRGLTRGERPASVPATYDSEPLPSAAPAGPDPVQSAYQAPKVLRYLKNSDELVYQGENGFEMQVPVADFIERYPTMLYGYGYLYCSNRKFIMMDAATHDIIFPVHYRIPEPAGRTPAVSRESVVDSEPVVSERVSFADLDDDGYTLADKKKMIENQAALAELRHLTGS